MTQFEEQYKYGPQIEQSENWLKAIERIKWSVKKAGYNLPKVNWYFHTWVHCKEFEDARFAPIGAVTVFNDKSCTIRCAVRNQKLAPVSLMIHEMAHAVSGLVENDDHPHDHSDLWGVIQARIYRWYWDTEEGPERPPYYLSRRPEDI